MSLLPADWDDRLGRRLRLRDLHVLLTVAQAGSMAQAAARLGVTQPAVSQAVAELEAALGVRLLDRSPRGVVPTLYGDALLRRGAEALDALRQGVRDIRFLADPGSATMVIGASESYVAGGFLAAIIHRLAQSHPRLAIQVVEANTAAQDFPELRERRVDLMLGRLSPGLVAEDLHFEPLFEEPVHIVAGAQHDWARRPDIGLAELAGKPWLLAPEGTAVQAVVARAFATAGLEAPRATVTTYSMTLRLQLLATGDYLTAFPGSLLRYNADRWALQALPISLGPPLPVVIATLRNRTLSPAVQVFVEEARKSTRSLRGEER